VPATHGRLASLRRGASPDAVRRVFEVLAPVLVTGRTKFLFGFQPRPVEGVDAADYQQPARRRFQCLRRRVSSLARPVRRGLPLRRAGNRW